MTFSWTIYFRLSPTLFEASINQETPYLHHEQIPLSPILDELSNLPCPFNRDNIFESSP